MKKLNLNRKALTLFVAVIVVLGWTEVEAGVTLTPVSVSRLYGYADSDQAGGTAGYADAEWNVGTGPLGSPSASAEYDPIGPPTDGLLLDGVSSFAIAHSKMTDAGGWSTFDDSDGLELFVNNQATGDPGGVPWGWGYSVSYLLVTYDTDPTDCNSFGDPMTVRLDMSLSGSLWASDIYDDYFLDVGYALGTGLTDYNPVVVDPANNPNPGLGQFDNYESWRSTGFSSEEPTLSDSLEFTGVIGDQVQVLLALSSFSWSMWGYTWTDGTLDATLTAIPETAPSVCVARQLKELAIEELEALRPEVNMEGEKRLNAALEYLNESLYGEPGDEEELWLDGSHLSPDNGDDVFSTENDAVEKLMEVLEKPGEFGASEDVVAEIVNVIENKILEADRLLAQTAIDEASSGDPDLLAEANEEMDKAALAKASGEYDKAVEHYFKAWEAALKSVGMI